MADLSTLDPLLPLSSDPISEGDDKIRETRDATINSFNLEHHLVGAHTFPLGDDGVRPAAGFPGRIFLNTIKEFVELDNGSVWHQLHGIKIDLLATAAISLPLNFVGDTQNILTTTINVRANSKVLVMNFINWQVTGGADVQGSVTAFFDGVASFPPASAHFVQLGGIWARSVGIFTPGPTAFSPLASGSHTLTLVGRIDFGAGAVGLVATAGHALIAVI